MGLLVAEVGDQRLVAVEPLDLGGITRGMVY
jgi:hypothetical protein